MHRYLETKMLDEMQNPTTLMLWAGHVFVLIACIAVEPNGWRSVCLLLAWLVTGIGGVVYARRWRAYAMMAIVLSGCLIWKTVLFVALDLTCAMGDCV